jgi:hypothetical protein
LSAEVTPMLLHQPLADEQPQPEKEGHRGVLGVIGQPTGGINIRFLDDVRRIDPSLQSAIHSQSNHTAEPRVVLIHELLPGDVVAVGCSLDERFRLLIVELSLAH